LIDDLQSRHALHRSLLCEKPKARQEVHLLKRKQTLVGKICQVLGIIEDGDVAGDPQKPLAIWLGV